MYTCLECGLEFLNIWALVSHISKVHILSSEEYYLKYIGNKQYCEYCLLPLKFLSINRGYGTGRFCSHKCANTVNNKTSVKETLANKSEEEKKQIRTKQSQTWHNRPKEEKDKIVQQRVQSTNMTERSFKYKQTMKNKSEEELKIISNNISNSWKNKTQEEKNRKTEKQRDTNINNNFWVAPIFRSEFNNYLTLVRKITKTFSNEVFLNWNGYDYYTNEFLITNDEFKKNNPNKSLNTNLLQPTIDHKISILEGFIKNIPAEIIGNINNLCVCSRRNNSRKMQIKLKEWK